MTEPVIDKSVPNSARIWNYFLGGKDHYPVDEEAGDAYLAAFPGIADIARTGRLFLGRVVRYLVQEEGIGQFLDIGTGLPTVDNTHELAQRADPSARIVYVDNDPLVLSHARALLTSTPEGATDYIDADMREPAMILEKTHGTLDFDRPVALTLMGVLGHVGDDGEAHALVAELLDGLPPGSFLALYDSHDENAALNEAQQRYDGTGAVPYKLRSRAQIEAFFSGLELVEPGVVPCPRWRPEVDFGDVPDSPTLCGVGRKA
ncbi:SAM-dependent methyltransferase [Actinocorallia sp. B10E7]|uniref:SAM-dependent methyltransferase n=1 Tax=Actinocorallia sp. B10E7 TaxID=3153558 RepID=UPI00325C4E54